MKQITLWGSLSLVLSCASCSKKPTSTPWTVTIDDGTKKKEESITVTESSAAFDTQMKAILLHHLALSGLDRTPRLGLHRLAGDDVPRKLAGVAPAGTRLEAGPYQIVQRKDGLFQLILGNPERPEILVDGAPTLLQVQRSTLHYIRLQLVDLHPQLSAAETW
jgi:hypothetical protein